jgi:hypothetical protein
MGYVLKYWTYARHASCPTRRRVCWVCGVFVLLVCFRCFLLASSVALLESLQLVPRLVLYHTATCCYRRLCGPAVVFRAGVGVVIYYYVTSWVCLGGMACCLPCGSRALLQTKRESASVCCTIGRPAPACLLQLCALHLMHGGIVVLHPQPRPLPVVHVYPPKVSLLRSLAIAALCTAADARLHVCAIPSVHWHVVLCPTSGRP